MKFKESKGSYNCWEVNGEDFDLSNRYTCCSYLGSGAYGVVAAVYDNNSSEYLAVKKCKTIFNSKSLAKRTLREMRILRIVSHPNVISIRNILCPHDRESFSDVYMVFPVMETDLSVIIRSSQTLSDEHIEYFISQLLQALSHLHSLRIIHRVRDSRLSDVHLYLRDPNSL